jgi:hypothetical protein
MKTLLDTAKRVRIADLAPGDGFRLDTDRDVNSHIRIDDDSPHLDGDSAHIYSLYRGRIVEHEPAATGLVVDLTREGG